MTVSFKSTSSLTTSKPISRSTETRDLLEKTLSSQSMETNRSWSALESDLPKDMLSIWLRSSLRRSESATISKSMPLRRVSIDLNILLLRSPKRINSELNLFYFFYFESFIRNWIIFPFADTVQLVFKRITLWLFSSWTKKGSAKILITWFQNDMWLGFCLVLNYSRQDFWWTVQSLQLDNSGLFVGWMNSYSSILKLLWLQISLHSDLDFKSFCIETMLNWLLNHSSIIVQCYNLLNLC